MTRLNASNRKTALEKKREQIEAQLKAIAAREKETARKEDTRRKVIAGALALEHMDKNPHSPFAGIMHDLLTNYVEPRSRYLFPFVPPVEPPKEGPSAAPSPPPAALAASAAPAAVSVPPAPVPDKPIHEPAPAAAAPATPAVVEARRPNWQSAAVAVAGRPQPDAAPVPSHPAGKSSTSGTGKRRLRVRRDVQEIRPALRAEHCFLCAHCRAG